MLSQGYTAAGLVTMVTIFVAAAIIFLVGFFPVSIVVEETKFDILPNLTEIAQSNRSFSSDLRYNQTILILVDALRYDFPTAATMPFSLKSSCGQLQMRVNLPTVTMPRLKSLTTGTVSNFIDIVFNLGHEEKVENSILQGLRKRDYNVVFAGDRTWVELFPNIFHRKTPNIDSFFVNDFYEGDKNVTNVLKSELQRDDWHFLILHYLGLDHIGHVEGSTSAKIPPKLREMDDSLERIYKAKQFRNQLVILTGDHGMRNGGGHGGASWEELHVPLLYFKEKCTKKSAKNNVYNQIDVAATLAILLGIDIPKNSIGCLVSELLEDLQYEEQLQAFALNAQHLLNKMANKQGLTQVMGSNAYNWLVQAQRLHSDFLKKKLENNIDSVVLFEAIKMEYIRASNEMSSQLSASLVNFDYDFISIGIVLAILITANMFVTLFSVVCEPKAILKDVRQIFFTSILGVVAYVILYFLDYIQNTTFKKCSVLICGLAAIFYVFIEFLKLCRRFRLTQTIKMSINQYYLLTIYLFTICSLASSSFIEYEQRTWYYLGSSIFILFLGTYFNKNRHQVNHIDSSVNIVINEIWKSRRCWATLVILATIRRYNDITFTETQSTVIFILALLSLVFQLRRLISPGQMIISVIALVCIYAIRDTQYNRFINGLLTGFWIGIGAICLLGHLQFFNKYKTIKPIILALRSIFASIVIIAALLHKPQNVVLIPLMFFILKTTYKLCDNLNAYKERGIIIFLLTKVLLTIFVGKIFYFAQGNTNSLATIDLNPGYIGQSSYNPYIVFIFVMLNTYCAPLSAIFYLVSHLMTALDYPKRSEQYQIARQNLFVSLHLYTLAILLPAVVYMCLLIALRFHLFIYSVFAPKIFYEVFNVLVHYIALCITCFYSKFL